MSPLSLGSLFKPVSQKVLDRISLQSLNIVAKNCLDCPALRFSVVCTGRALPCLNPRGLNGLSFGRLEGIGRQVTQKRMPQVAWVVLDEADNLLHFLKHCRVIVIVDIALQ